MRYRAALALADRARSRQRLLAVAAGDDPLARDMAALSPACRRRRRDVGGVMGDALQHASWFVRAEIADLGILWA
ncbi:MAG: hypothetical protein R2708_10785 [Vicinamibacterales bacterium]